MAYAAARADEPDHAEDVLDEIRQEISADDAQLGEARDRRNLVSDAAKTFESVRRSFNSGSLAHGTVNKPVSDADCGIVFDRRHHPTLGPDGDGVGPDDIMDALRDHVMDRVREDYPDARSRLTKRAILVRFNAPTADGVDPSVDLIAALNRKDAKGLWIPNRDKDDWDASDPICHTDVLTTDPKALRVFRARVVRMAKAAIKSNGNPVLISFNVEALALKSLTEVTTLGEGLERFFDGAASSIRAGLTNDPADVSGRIKLPDGITRETAAKRLRFFADRIAEARENSDDRPKVEAALAELYPKQLPHAARSAKAQLASELSGGNSSPRVSRAFGLGAGGLKTTRSHGDA
jgi:hypothetical protein